MKLRRKYGSDEFKGFLDHGTSVTGELTFSGTLRVDGNIHGSITTSDLLIVGERATIHADIKAGEIQVYGSVFGNIEGVRRVDIFSSGRLRGDIRTPQLVIEEGGSFEGRSRGASESNSQAEEEQEFSEPAKPAKKESKEWPDRFHR